MLVDISAKASSQREKTVRAIIDEQAHRQSDAVFLTDPDSGVDLTYRDLQSRALNTAAFLHKMGIKPGESVAFAMSNSHESVAILYGIFYGGFRATAVNLVSGMATVGYVLDHSESRLVITEETHRPLLQDAMKDAGLDLQLINADGILAQEADENDLPPENMRTASDDGLLMYTSGTTGRPKGVLLSHGNLIAGGENATIAHKLDARDRALCVLPLYHINGLCVTLMGPLVSGGSVVLPHRFSASKFWTIIREHECTWFSVVPTQISYLLHGAKKDGTDATGLEQVRFGRSASAPLAPEVQEAFETCFNVPIVETMGLTETAAQILSNPLPPGTRKIGSPGIAYGNEILIADDQQNEVPRGQEGEVLVRGDNVMKLYFKNDEATSQALTGKKWLRTGDLGRMDEDGYVFITGRLKELIIKGGENIAPREVDEALYAHPSVIEAAAFACDCPNYGQRIEAGVAIDAGATVSETDLLALCEKRLGKFKTPDRIHFLPELPKGPSGKIQRIKLAKLFESG